jgi:hypothetical protein
MAEAGANFPPAVLFPRFNFRRQELARKQFTVVLPRKNSLSTFFSSVLLFFLESPYYN